MARTARQDLKLAWDKLDEALDLLYRAEEKFLILPDKNGEPSSFSHLRSAQTLIAQGMAHLRRARE